MGPPPIRCDSPIPIDGADEGGTYSIELGEREGTLNLVADTHFVADNIIFRYEGTELTRTGCFGTDIFEDGSCTPLGWCCRANGECWARVKYGPGSSTTIEVETIPSCDSDTNTLWSFRVSCPL
jgi:hypothetical protein